MIYGHTIDVTTSISRFLFYKMKEKISSIHNEIQFPNICVNVELENRSIYS